MTSIQFQIDAERLRMLHGTRADSYIRRRERERNERLGRNGGIENNAMTRDSYDALQLADRNPRSVRVQQQRSSQARDVPGYQSQARANNAALRFAAVGGMPLDLDNIGYDQLQELFPAPARGGVAATEIEACSNVFK